MQVDSREMQIYLVSVVQVGWMMRWHILQLFDSYCF